MLLQLHHVLNRGRVLLSTIIDYWHLHMYTDCSIYLLLIVYLITIIHFLSSTCIIRMMLSLVLCSFRFSVPWMTVVDLCLLSLNKSLAIFSSVVEWPYLQTLQTSHRLFSTIGGCWPCLVIAKLMMY